jgi:hypothetical protein
VATVLEWEVTNVTDRLGGKEIHLELTRWTAGNQEVTEWFVFGANDETFGRRYVWSQPRAAGSARRRYPVPGTGPTRFVNTHRPPTRNARTFARTGRMAPWPSWWTPA